MIWILLAIVFVLGFALGGLGMIVYLIRGAVKDL